MRIMKRAQQTFVLISFRSHSLCSRHCFKWLEPMSTIWCQFWYVLTAIENSIEASRSLSYGTEWCLCAYMEMTIDNDKSSSIKISFIFGDDVKSHIRLAMCVSALDSWQKRTNANQKMHVRMHPKAMHHRREREKETVSSTEWKWAFPWVFCLIPWNKM